MARSRRKYPIVRQEKIDKLNDNRKFRRLKLDYCPKGSQYKRLVVDWSKWAYRWTREEAIQEYNNSERLQRQFESVDKYLNYWAKIVIRK